MSEVEKNIGAARIDGGYLMYLGKKATVHPRLWYFMEV